MFSSSKKIFKIGKKFCFPEVPSTWISRTVECILYSQDCFNRKPNLADSHDIYPAPPKYYDYEADQNSCCNPYSCYYPITDRSNNVQQLDAADKNSCYNPFFRRPIRTGIPCSDEDARQLGYVTRLPPMSTSPKDGYSWSCRNFARTSDHFALDDMLENERFSLEEGQNLDIISLLNHGRDTDNAAYLVRNNGDKVPVDTLRGKSILVFCVFMPCFWWFGESNTIRSLFTLRKHWDQKAHENSNIEMVVVAKMRRNWCNDEDAFNHFFSGFPSSWLAVPFSDMLCRDHVCRSIGLADCPEAVLVDSNQKVVFHESCFLGGFQKLPFCDPDNRDLWWKKYTQLDMILDLDPHYVFKTNNNSNKVSISELKEKVVGLYLCIDGSFIKTLDLISQQCKAQNQEFEVVLVYLPYKDGVDPPLFLEAVNHVLHKFNITNWWVAPFDDFVSRRLWEVFVFPEEDELVVLDPHTNNADPFAKSVLYSFGVNAYPFTREFLILRELEALQAVTLESLLVYGSRDHVLRIDDDNKSEEVPIAQLRGKNVILYVDRVETPVPKTYHKLLDWYNWIKSTRVADDFEVVFVCATPFGSPKLLPTPMPWLVCPYDLQHTTFVSRKTLKSDCVGYTVPFGKDGHMIKLHAIDLLEKYEPEGFPPHRNLCEDIINHFGFHYDLDMTGVFDPLTD